MILKKRICVKCGQEYSPDGMTQKYCTLCGAIVREEQRKAQYERRKERQEQEKRRINRK